MNVPVILLLTLVFCLSGCRSHYLPEGDPEAGRVAFSELQCFKCHRVANETFPEPTADPPLPFVLGSSEDPLSREAMAEAIISPSHRFAQPPAVLISDELPIYVQDEYENIQEGSLSRMGDFSEVITVRQWIDIVAYLEKMQLTE